MERRVIFLSLLLFLLIAPHVFAGNKLIKLCPRFTLRTNGDVTLKESERLLVCGDPKNPAWNQIPDNQAVFNLKTYLQARGFYHPDFVKGAGGGIIVDVGVPTRVIRFASEGDPPPFDLSRLRHVVGEILTPALLDAVRTRIRDKLTANGYPCPKVQMEGNSDTGALIAHLSNGAREEIARVDRQPVPRMDSRFFGRYDAFRIGDPYNADFLAVTVNRILDQAMVQGVYFTARCEAEGAIVNERFVPGPPRLVSFGVGIDTERLIRVRAGWKNSRMGKTGSLIDLTAVATVRDQSFNANLKWYVLPLPDRFYLRPSFSIKHENLLPYENLTSRLRLAPAITHDTRDLGMSLYFGPTFNLVRILRGSGPSFAKFMSLSGQYRLTDHYYEFYRGSPRRGFDLRVNANLAQNDWLSDISAQLVQVGFEKLWNVGSFDPPFLVLGLRGMLGTTFTNQNVYTSTLLPTDFRFFLGGSQDLRGFGLRELPGGTNGALTAVYLGGEARVTDALPWGIQPFLFWDVAVMGSQPVLFDSPVLHSPGVGIRWQSKIGVIRSTLAHGYFQSQPGYPDSLSHWQFYFSFGEEF